MGGDRWLDLRRGVSAPSCLLLLASMFAVSAAPRADDSIVIEFGSPMVYQANNSDPGPGQWTDPGFTPVGWQSGSYGVGFGTDAPSANLVQTTIANGHQSIFTRATFDVADVNAVQSLLLDADYDDGVVAWINGVEVYRSPEMAGLGEAWDAAAVSHESSNGLAPAYTPTQDISLLGIPALVNGQNLLAIGVWNDESTSSDLVLAPRLRVVTDLVRRPYLQMGTPTSVMVRWRTATASQGEVRYGTDPGNLSSGLLEGWIRTEHEVTLSGLTPRTRYYYEIKVGGQTLASGPDYFFDTPPSAGVAKPTRVWVLGDSGRAFRNTEMVRDAYHAFNNRHTDLWLMLGDNAYPNGTDVDYQLNLFDVFPGTLRKSVLWPTIGNHDNFDGVLMEHPYYNNFTMPTAAEAGGFPSGDEAYYSFDHANIHFVVLDSQASDRTPGSDMLVWLANDLGNTTQDWIVAFWHHPPYSKGGHDSDNPDGPTGEDLPLEQMREFVVPILDMYGVDLVLSGHSHSYERSWLIEGHYGTSDTFVPGMQVDPGDGELLGDGPWIKQPRGTVPYTGPGDGTVYAVAGSASAISPGEALDLGGPGPLQQHPAMHFSLLDHGSLVLDVDGNRLDARFIDKAAAVRDHFTMFKGGPTLPPLAAFGAPQAVAPSTPFSFTDLTQNWPSSWTWDFEDNGSVDSLEPEPGHQYDQMGLYSVKLSVSNSAGADVELKSGYICVTQGTPTEITGLNGSADRVQLSWDAEPRAIEYDVIKGDLVQLLATGGDFEASQLACLAPTGTQASDAGQPGPGQVFYYVVRGISCNSGTGTFDTAEPSQSAPRDPYYQNGTALCPCSLGNDPDTDGRCNSFDNCPSASNPSQVDNDNDGPGDACDTCTDADADGFGNGSLGNVDCPEAPTDVDDLDAFKCTDTDTDQCDDCTSGVFDPSNDGTDGDGDGRCNVGDNCPSISNPLQQDGDSDDIGDVCDPCTDADGDGLGNGGNGNAGCLDPTTDSNDADGFVCADLDGDGCDDCSGGSFDVSADGADADTDGVCDTGDNCVDDSNPAQDDADSDLVGDACDTCNDVDGDGLGDGSLGNAGCADTTTDSNDADPFLCADTDGDGCEDCSGGSFAPAGDGADADTDGLCDIGDSCTDVDGDGLGNGNLGNATCLDPTTDSNDADANLCADTDADGCDDCSGGSFAPAGDGADADTDGICDPGDNCVNNANPAQIDSDGDGPGDACDTCTDGDGDGLGNGGLGNPGCAEPTTDSNDADANVCADTDGDGCDDCSGGSFAPAGDGADADTDGICDPGDNCPEVANPAQTDSSANGVGDVCQYVVIGNPAAFAVSVTEVTNGEYVAFLNAVAASDPNALFHPSMAVGNRGGIDRAGSDGSYVYSTRPNMGNKPVNFVSWLDAARYVNWLQNGKPVGAQIAGTTEDGTYDLSVTDPGPNAVRSAAVWFLPKRAQWDAAAYGDPGGGPDRLYPTASDGTPTEATADAVGNVSNPGANVANYSRGADWNSQDGNLTSVSTAGPLSRSGWGTFDQGGNVKEWVENRDGGDNRVVRGGSYRDANGVLESTASDAQRFDTEHDRTGFRIGTSTLCADTDGDGWCDPGDNCPSDANANQEDADADGPGDACDSCTDGDGDGLGNGGLGNSGCTNTTTDSNDADANVCADTDADLCDDCSGGTFAPAGDGTDTDTDGICDTGDNCDNDANPGQENADGDAAGDVCDTCTDVDGDGLGNGGLGNSGCADTATDSNDADANLCADTDGDQCDDCSGGGFAPAADGVDTDTDGICDTGDNCVNDANPDQENADADAAGDACDTCTDVDGDGLGNGGLGNSGCANATTDSNDADADLCADTDADLCDDCSGGGFAPAADGVDTDTDGICDTGDNCANDPNPAQDDADGDSVGDVCDTCNDVDGDGLGDGNLGNSGCTNSTTDSNDANGIVCADTDGDGCDDCSNGLFDVSDDGPDDDTDGVCNSGDNCPTTPNPPQFDADHDGIGDPCDTCTDNDGDGVGSGDLLNVGCVIPDNDSTDGNPNVCADTDGDGCDDCSSGTWNTSDDGTDNDLDGVCNVGDNCDDDANPGQQNADGDALGDACDTCNDVDGDGLGDGNLGNTGCANATTDSNDGNASVCADTDADGCEDCSNGGFAPSADGADADADGICNVGDNCVNDSNPAQTDTDGDGPGDACDNCTDADGDGLGNGTLANAGCTDTTTDSNDGNANVCADTDADTCDDCSGGSFAPAADGTDSDSDGICNLGDNCIGDSNAAQTDTDSDGAGDACDNCTDADDDGLGNGNLANAGCANTTTDSNDANTSVCADTDADTCDDCSNGSFNTGNDGTDNDSDGVCNAGDNCDDTANPAQDDADSDNIGDACDTCNDVDGDGLGDGNLGNTGCVNTTTDSNDGNANLCGDTDGDACEDCSGGSFAPGSDGTDNDADGICNLGDNCIDDANAAQTDTDSDGAGDACDNCTDADGDGLGNGNLGNAGCTNSTTDSNDGNANVCADTDADTCDDCSNGTFNASNDGADSDSDGICNVGDNCPTTSNPPQFDADNDGIGDPCDTCTDNDGDGVGSGDLLNVGCVIPDNDSTDGNPNVCADTDADGCDDCSSGTWNTSADGTDNDSDGVCNLGDNCVDAANASQDDADSDGLGDACDTCNDVDGDGLGDGNLGNTGCVNTTTDSNDGNSNLCADTDGDTCEDCSGGSFAPGSDGTDNDADGICNLGDNCVDDANASQTDTDADGPGDACDTCTDADEDGLGNGGLGNTSCTDSTTDSNDGNANVCADTDGDTCDDCSGGSFAPAADGTDNDADGICNLGDNCVDDSNAAQTDTDSDGAGDACDNCTDADGDGLGNGTLANAGCTNTTTDSNDGNANLCADTDGDTCDDCSNGSFNVGNDGTDNDSDGVCNAGDNCDDTSNPNQDDADSDNVGDACDTCNDVDGDGLGDGNLGNTGCVNTTTDSNDGNANLCGDTDNDTCEDCLNGDYDPGDDGTDTDSDGICNATDNCVSAANPSQADNDSDGTGDACDTCTDGDGDGLGTGTLGNSGCTDSTTDSNDGNANVCADTDADTCDDCSGGSFAPAADGTDNDADGICNLGDNCVDDSNAAQTDTDSDGAGDACDTCTDADGDGLGNGTLANAGCTNATTDSNDGNANLCADTDGDTCDDCSNGSFNVGNDGTDNDSDGVCNAGDNCDDTSNPSQDDADSDNIGDVCDTCNDVDGDGLGDGNLGNTGCVNTTTDSNDGNANLCGDTDNDTCEDCLNGDYDPGDDGTDTDSDGICNATDNCVSAANPTQLDSDSDGSGDACDSCSDADGDGLGNGSLGNSGCTNSTTDSNDSNANVCADTDGDTCDDCVNGDYDPSDDGTDTELDGICDAGDNCPTTWNPPQYDADNDGIGDPCDTCTDNDGDGVGSGDLLNVGCVIPDNDSTDGNPNVCADTDADTCDDCTSGSYDPDNDGTDTDGDGICDSGDNCVLISNPNQLDTDMDGTGDACECKTTDSDDFSTSGSPPAGWSVVRGTWEATTGGELQITANVGRSLIYRTVETCGTDQWVRVTQPELGLENGATFRQVVDDTSARRYVVYWDDNNSRFKWDSCTGTTVSCTNIDSSSELDGQSDGTVFGFEVTGTGNDTVVKAWIDPSGADPSAWGTADWTSTTNPGASLEANTGEAVGLCVRRALSGQRGTFDDFEAGGE